MEPDNLFKLLNLKSVNIKLYRAGSDNSPLLTEKGDVVIIIRAPRKMAYKYGGVTLSPVDSFWIL